MGDAPGWTSGYFAPTDMPFIINLRVDDIDGWLATARERGDNVLELAQPED